MSKKPTKKTPVTHAEHFRLRLPSERPTVQECDKDARFLVHTTKSGWMVCCLANEAMFALADCCLPGHLPAHLIPKPETSEERMRREFEEWAKKERYNLDRHGEGYMIDCAQSAWESWQAAKTTL